MMKNCSTTCRWCSFVSEDTSASSSRDEHSVLATSAAAAAGERAAWVTALRKSAPPRRPSLPIRCGTPAPILTEMRRHRTKLLLRDSSCPLTGAHGVEALRSRAGGCSAPTSAAGPCPPDGSPPYGVLLSGGGSPVLAWRRQSAGSRPMLDTSQVTLAPGCRGPRGTPSVRTGVTAGSSPSSGAATPPAIRITRARRAPRAAWTARDTGSRREGRRGKRGGRGGT
mmetsp:Transcript_118581/g.330843  ORF Transcript_118581/g.330843 Transcript_118581/m.330843 type:complete len:225 (+) Transcript_118581:588-1262(+)